MGIKYIDPCFDEIVIEKYIEKYGPKKIIAFKKGIDALYKHKKTCISKNCFTCNAIYISSRKIIQKVLILYLKYQHLILKLKKLNKKKLNPYFYIIKQKI